MVAQLWRYQNMAKRLDVHTTVIRKLLDAPDQATFNDAWQFITRHFGQLYTLRENVAELRKAIIQLAVMGRLVKQDVKEESAFALLERIKKEKEKMAKKGIIKLPSLPPEISGSDKPFKLPNGWIWCRLENICSLITKGSSPKWQGVSYTQNPKDVLFITSENVGSYKLLIDNKKYVQKTFNEIEPRSILRQGDYLMNIVGASIGRTAIYDINDIANINQAVCLIRIIPESIDQQYLLHFFNSNICISYMFDKQVDNARANLSLGNISNFVIPFPPLQEQERIVNKVDSLMHLCESLETQIDYSYGKRKELLSAMMSE